VAASRYGGSSEFRRSSLEYRGGSEFPSQKADDDGSSVPSFFDYSGFEDAQMKVDVSGAILRFPQECACCGASADANLTISATRSWGKRVVHSEARAWEVPYCTSCLEHVQRYRDAGMFARVATAVSLGAAALLGYLEGVYWGVGVAVGLIALTIFIYSRLLKLAERYSNHGCVGLHPAISYDGWSGSLHSFEIASSTFARDFMLTNERRLVNLSAQATKLLSVPGPRVPQSCRRSSRRHVS
jgi:hypothetical protein